MGSTLDSILFDGSLSVPDYNYGYFYGANYQWQSHTFIELNLQEKANIYCYGHGSYQWNRGKLNIYTKPTNSNTWVLSSIQENTLTAGTIDWQKAVSELPAGLYRFTSYGIPGYASSVPSRIDTEWFIEKAFTEKTLIKNGDAIDSQIISIADTSIDFTQSTPMTKTTLGTGFMHVGGSYDRTIWNVS